jgi:hypothetical protein
MRRIHPAYLVAVLALVLAGTGTGYAAGTLITSKQIKDKTIKLKDIAPKTRAKLRGNTGPTGPQGPQGGTGATGPRGFSAWDTIPADTVVRGAWSFGGADGIAPIHFVTLPGRAPTGIDIDHVVTWPDPHCSGTLFDPVPLPGYVCVTQLGYNVAGSGAPKVAQESFQTPDLGFALTLSDLGTATAYNAFGVWAYRAP